MTKKVTEIIYPEDSWMFETKDNESYDMFDRILPFITNKMNTTGLMSQNSRKYNQETQQER